MITDQARNLRIMAEHRAWNKKSFSGRFDWKRAAIYLTAAAIAGIFLYFQYSGQKALVQTMNERNKNLEERLILLGFQMEEIRHNVDTTLRDSFLLQKEITSLAAQRDAALAGLKNREEKIAGFNSEIDVLQQELAALKYSQAEMNRFLTENIRVVLDDLEEKTRVFSRRLEEIGQQDKIFDPEEILGRVVFSAPDNSFVVISHQEKTAIEPGQFIAVQRGKDRLAILKAIEVRSTVSACVIEELWGEISKGDEVRKL